MTHKTALTLALFATLGTTACSVDAPTRDNFDYSFLDEMPEGLTTELGFAAPVEANFRVLFRDGLYGTEFVSPKADEVHLEIDRIMVEAVDGHGGSKWFAVRDSPISVDLLTLADGEVARLGGGPVPAGRYGAVALRISQAWVLNAEGFKQPLALPGSVLSLDTELISVDADEMTTLTLDLGALRSLEYDGDEWYAEPSPSYTVDGD